MKVIIAGSRNITNQKYILQTVLESPFNVKDITEIVIGGCRGVDQLAGDYALSIGFKLKLFKADWNLGPKAGPIRNEQMAKYADALILIWDGKSKGSKSMLQLAKKHKLKIYQKII